MFFGSVAMLMIAALLGIAAVGSVLVIGGDGQTDDDNSDLDVIEETSDEETPLQSSGSNLFNALSELEDEPPASTQPNLAPPPPSIQEPLTDGLNDPADIPEKSEDGPPVSVMSIIDPEDGPQPGGPGAAGLDPFDPETDVLSDLVEALNGSEGNDVLSGSSADNIMALGAGNDVATGGAGNDTLLGGLGDDTMQGGQGSDLLEGQDGNDNLSGWQGDDKLLGGAGDDVLMGHIGNDASDGGAGNDTIEDGAGNDTLYGGTGNDALLAGEDNDSLRGGTGQDTLHGDDGNDILIGNDDSEMDFLNGGNGDDTLFAGDGDIVHTGEGADVVVLEDGAEIDLIDFTKGVDVIELTIQDDPDTADIDIEYDAPSDTTLILVNGWAFAALNGNVEMEPDDIRLTAA